MERTLFSSEIQNLTDYPEYDLMPGHRASNIKLLEDDPRDYRDIVMPSPYHRAIMPRDGSSMALNRGSLVDERVFRRKKNWRFTDVNKNSNAFKELNTDPAIIWVSERSPMRNEANNIYENQLLGMCRNVMALMRAEFGPNWRDPPALMQYSIQWTRHVGDYPIPMKELGDYYNGCYVDLKVSSYPREPARAADDYGYDIKDAHYSAGHLRAGLDTSDSRLLYVSTSYPYRAKFWSMPNWMREIAAERYENCIRNLHRGLEFNDWEPVGYFSNSRDEFQPRWHEFKYGPHLNIDNTGIEVVNHGETD